MGCSAHATVSSIHKKAKLIFFIFVRTCSFEMVCTMFFFHWLRICTLCRYVSFIQLILGVCSLRHHSERFHIQSAYALSVSNRFEGNKLQVYSQIYTVPRG